jgi:predicted DCC family thiol-disulfide oxidoreductase YuxK
MGSDSPRPLLVIYDGDCGVCQATVDWFGRRDLRGQLSFQSNAEPLPPEVKQEQTTHTVFAIDRSSGRQWVRAAALARMLAALPGWAVLGFLLRVPPISWFADLGYRLFARNRHRVSHALGLRACSISHRPRQQAAKRV